jgi:HPt (histidine-containing phosphotransfer) domain-containing protein
MQQTLPIIDWNEVIRITGSKANAIYLLNLLLVNLHKDLEELKMLYHESNWDCLKQKLHKLRGGLSYCGVPRLKNLVIQIESDLKNNVTESIPTLLTQFESEVNLLYKQQPSLETTI